MSNIEHMTEQDVEYFIGAARIGMACGLSHPWEWLANIQRSLDIWPYEQQMAINQAYVAAFTHFWNGCDAHPSDPCKTANTYDLLDEIDRWYRRERVRHESR